MWYEQSVFYHIYPLGFCSAPEKNSEPDDTAQSPVNRIEKVAEWIPHLRRLGIGAVYFGPVFESDEHGYDTRDYTKIDRRLGENADFAEVCEKLHGASIKVVPDGVFNHVGRGFWAFRDVLKNRQNSKYLGWFNINLGGNSSYGDNLWYEGWEGHFNLVKLNLKNPEVVDYLLDCVCGWIEQFDIDGLRLDVAYMLDRDFMRRLRRFTSELKPGFFLLGETIHGDYNQLVNDELLHSCTNYECFKGLFSSFNDLNMFEIAYSLNRQFGPEQWTLYKGKHLLCFADNHDVSRLASNLKESRHIPLVYTLLYGMPGIPCIYYGSEWGAKGDKKSGDRALRPSFEKPERNTLTGHIEKLSEIRKENPALSYGDYKQLYLTNRQFAFLREYNGERVAVAVNLDSEPHSFRLPVTADKLTAQFEDKEYKFTGSVELKAYSSEIFRID